METLAILFSLAAALIMILGIVFIFKSSVKCSSGAPGIISFALGWVLAIVSLGLYYSLGDCSDWLRAIVALDWVMVVGGLCGLGMALENGL